MAAIRYSRLRIVVEEAREVEHPQLFRSMLEDKPALYFPAKVEPAMGTRKALILLTCEVCLM